jgi:hypothetical protein
VPSVRASELPEAACCTACGGLLPPDERRCTACGGTAAEAPDSVLRWQRVLDRLRAATLGEFEILRQIGRGGMAAVFLAHEIALDRKVAIKVMAPGLLLADGMVERFRNEAITVARLEHPHIVTIHAVRQWEDLHFFVMQFVEGRSLDHVVRAAGPLPLPTIRGIASQVGSALAYAHRRGVVHRDVKPANLLISSAGDAVVTDFGIAKLMEAPGATQTGMMIGTAAYMSPEQFLGLPATGASDQYALGIVLHELLTGRPPFGGTTLAMMHAHVQQPPPPVRLMRADCPAETEAAVLRMLEKDPGDRWPSLSEALQAFGAAPLAEADPSRLELIRLAAPDADVRAAVHTAAPPSPIPIQQPDAIPRRVAEAPLPERIVIRGAPEAIAVGDVVLLHADVISASADAGPAAEVSWSSADPSIAVVDPDGRLAAISPGRAEVAARAGAARTTVQVSVVPPDSRDAAGEPSISATNIVGGPTPHRAVVIPGVETQPPTLSERRERRRRGARAGLAVAVLSVAAVLVGAAVLLTTGPRAAPPKPLQVPSSASHGAQVTARPDITARSVEGTPEGAAVEPGRVPSGGTADPPLAGAGPPPAEMESRQKPVAHTPARGPAPDADSGSPEADAEREVAQAVRAFVRALETGDASRVRGAYPGLRGEEPWWQFAEANRAAGLRTAYFALQPGSPHLIAPDSAEAFFDVGLTYSGSEERPQPFMFRAILRRAGARWRLVEVRYF